MKQTITVLFMCIVALGINAQQKANIEVSYSAHYPNMRNGKDDLKSRYILLANVSESKFFSPMTEYIDSLNSTVEGKAKYQELTTNAYIEGTTKKIPRKDGSYYVIKSRTTNKFTYFDDAGIDKYYYDENLPKWNWEISDSTKSILGYECIKATTVFHGRKWIVWFAPEISINAGPWKLEGLPGLILEAIAEGNQYRFSADGILNSDKELNYIYLANDYEKTDRITFLKTKRSFLDNPLGKINAQLAGEGVTTITNDDGTDVSSRLFASRSIVDFIEIDY